MSEIVWGFCLLFRICFFYSFRDVPCNELSLHVDDIICSFMQIMKNASETLIPVTLELGGKDAFIVCEDVDVDHV